MKWINKIPWNTIGFYYLFAIAGTGLGFFVAGLFQLSGLSWFNAFGNLAEIVTAISSLSIASLVYMYQRNNDQVRMAYELLGKYEEITIKRKEIRKIIDERRSEYFNDFSLVAIPEMTLSAYIKQFPDAFRAKYAFYRQESNEDVIERLNALLMELEAFATMVINAGLTEHPIIKTLKGSYVIFIEQHALAVLIHALNEKTPTYIEITNLYDMWKYDEEVVRNWPDLFREEIAKAQLKSNIPDVIMQGTPESSQGEMVGK